MTNTTQTDSFKIKAYTCICGRAVLPTTSGKALNLNGTPHVCGDPHAVKHARRGYNLRRA